MIICFKPCTPEEEKLFLRVMHTISERKDKEYTKSDVFAFNRDGRHHFLNIDIVDRFKSFDIRYITYEEFQVILRDYTILGDMESVLIDFAKSKGYEDDN
jgi:hypothetical protein